MQSGREVNIRSRIVKDLRGRGAYVNVNHGTAYSGRGRSDIEACLAGRFIAIETKTPAGKARAKQEWRLEQVRRAGGVGIIAREFAAYTEELETWLAVG